MYLKYYKKREKAIIDAIKKKTDAHIYFHSCGAVFEVIPDFIDIGVEILNPVQIQAAGMDSARLKRGFGKQITFWGGGCDPRVLTTGTIKDVEREVRKRIDDLLPGVDSCSHPCTTFRQTILRKTSSPCMKPH
jgi:uroporphyrinogen decarboxylase